MTSKSELYERLERNSTKEFTTLSLTTFLKIEIISNGVLIMFINIYP